MKLKTKQLSKLLGSVLIAICMLSMLAPSAFADCASDLNLCTTIAGNNQANCVSNARSNFTTTMVGCAALSLFCFPCGAACIIAAEVAETSAINTCNNNYDNDVANCQAAYQNCLQK